MAGGIVVKNILKSGDRELGNDSQTSRVSFFLADRGSSSADLKVIRTREAAMKYVKENDPREAPNDDPREAENQQPMTQSEKPWKQNPQTSTDPSQPDTPKPDLEKWQKSRTH